MSRLDHIVISEEPFDDDRRRFSITADQGYARSHLMTDNGFYEIDYYEVSKPDEGYGQELLRVVRQHAISLGARAITASNITTEKSAGAMSAVFGRRHLTGGIGTSDDSPWIHLFGTIRLDYPINYESV